MTFGQLDNLLMVNFSLLLSMFRRWLMKNYFSFFFLFHVFFLNSVIKIQIQSKSMFVELQHYGNTYNKLTYNDITYHSLLCDIASLKVKSLKVLL
jgi:hypothetical protein